ncbi:hypothetical protein QT711_15170 [Sporosarcina saromensis]|uniref:Uncharacterized protein n=1 Tax=Sporosarcina saromensis TaxID=359365 RepID=A0ABU4GC14_9BACL|nr:hypothetical protein [Sporosarcina saromensis]
MLRYFLNDRFHLLSYAFKLRNQLLSGYSIWSVATFSVLFGRMKANNAMTPTHKPINEHAIKNGHKLMKLIEIKNAA